MIRARFWCWKRPQGGIAGRKPDRRTLSTSHHQRVWGLPIRSCITVCSHAMGGRNAAMVRERELQLARPGNYHDGAYRVGASSGYGSAVQSTTTYRHVLETFIRLNGVRTVLDLACGDWQFSKFMPWASYGISYLGLDVSDYIIEVNTAAYTSDHCKFGVINDPSELSELGPFDLVICKDAMQHMPNDTINQYLDKFEKIGRHCLITNDIYPNGIGLNHDIEDGGWRSVDIRQPPFSRNACVFAEYYNYSETEAWIKQVHLLSGRA